MLTVEIDEANGIAIIEPSGPLSQSDFELAAKSIDPYLEKAGKLQGLVIHTENFPGWQSFAAMSTHFKFVSEHHKKIARIAFATDSVIGNIAESLANHFVNAEVKKFKYQEFQQAKDWVAG